MVTFEHSHLSCLSVNNVLVGWGGGVVEQRKGPVCVFQVAHNEGEEGGRNYFRSIWRAVNDDGGCMWVLGKSSILLVR